MKTLTISFVSVGWLFALVAVPASAQVNYAVSGDTAYVARSANASGDVVIASTYNGFPVTSIGDRAFENCTGLTSVTIPDSVTQIGTTLNGGPLGFAFYNCTSLTNVIMGNNVTNIGYAAFVHCTSLTRVTIPASVINIASSAFTFCTSLTNVTLLGNPPRLLIDFEAGGNWFSNVGPGARAYYYCGTTGWGATFGGLPTVMLCPAQINYAVSGNTAYVASSPNASGDVVIASTYLGLPVTSIGRYAFYNCTGLTSVTIPDSVTSIDDLAFYNCTSLTSMTMPNSVTSIGQLVFSQCTGLTSATIPNAVTRISRSTFAGCTSLTNVTIPDSVSSIGESAFAYCSRLMSVTIPDSVTNIRDRAFEGCAGLTGVAIPHRVTSLGPQTFSRCTSLTNISVAAANSAYSSVEGVLFNKAQTVLVTHPVARAGSLVIPGSVTSIGPWAFDQCTNLTGVTIPGGVTNIGPWAFSGCRSLTSVTIPSGVTNIWYFTFANCSSLTNVTFLGNAPRLVYEMDAGGGCWFCNVGAGAKAYYSCGTTGWGATYGDLSTVMLCPPQVGNAGVKPGGFGFTVTRLTNQTVVEASADLVNWQPIWTNTPPGVSADFVDPQWLQYSNRFYRARSQ